MRPFKLTFIANLTLLSEVDVWSLGIILYCLLTGTLPFDDDDEGVMRSKIIQGDFEDPIWLSLGKLFSLPRCINSYIFFSLESRDLIKNILQKEVTKRLTIPQILAHSWFTSRTPTYEVESPLPTMNSFAPHRSSTPESQSQRNPEGTPPDSSEVSTQESLSPFTRQPDLVSSTPTTPDESMSDPFDSTSNNILSRGSLHRHPSNSTIRKTSTSDPEPLSSKLVKTGDKQHATVIEENMEDHSRYTPPSPLLWSGPSSSKTAQPPSHPLRTPARTKRRSVSSILSDSGSPTAERAPTPLPVPSARDSDFASLLTTPTPIIFSTPTERHLLNALSTLGFDTAQIVHSVLTNACDAAGAVWWMLRKREERQILEDNEASALVPPPTGVDSSNHNREPTLRDKPSSKEPSKKKRNKSSVGIQTDPYNYTQVVNVPITAPKFTFVPATPTFVRPVTPPRPVSPTRSPMLSPSSSILTGEITSLRSHPSTPGGSLKDREKDSGSKGRKARSGSVSIMQRATTALEAAGLVRKKSSEAVREEKGREREREKSRETDRRLGSVDEPRLSHGSGSSKLSKSPPLKPVKDHPAPSTPPPSDQGHNAHIGSPWVLAEKKDSLLQPQRPQLTSISATNVQGEMLHSHSAPNFSETVARKAGEPPLRNRANILTTLRLWFHEDKKGKRKVDTPASVSSSSNYPRSRRGSGSNGKFGPRGTHRGRLSISSHRSSSVNSRRSSGTSIQMIVVDSPQVPTTRRSLGTHTPNSERGEFSSRPSSIRSVSRQPRHRKSPSQSSAGSIHLRTASPMQKYHRRAGSGSSARVVRQVVTRGPHVRSNSAASSIHSPPSSRPTSFYDPSESELGPRSSSPIKTRSRRSIDDNSRSRSSSGSTTFVTQKRQIPFMNPVYGPSIGRSSWKKSWGIEPPGWQSRTAIEVLAISPPGESVVIRDVFSGKQSVNLGDESDWVDEDDDIPAFAGGLGQMGAMVSSIPGGAQQIDSKPATVTLSPAPRGQRVSKRAIRNTGSSSGGGLLRQKGGQSPAERASPLPPDTGYDSSETRTGRRQLPTAHSGPAAIQEEDEGEEE